MKEKKRDPRGAKKGRPIQWNTRPTIKSAEEKLKQVQYKAYAWEIERMNELLSKMKGNRKFLKLLDAVEYYVDSLNND